MRFVRCHRPLSELPEVLFKTSDSPGENCIEGGVRVTHWVDWPTQCVTLAKLNLKGYCGDTDIVQLENILSALVSLWKYRCMICWYVYILKHCRTFTVNDCVYYFEENINVKFNTSTYVCCLIRRRRQLLWSLDAGMKHPCITESGLQQAVAIRL